MENSTKAGIGVGAATLIGGLIGQGLSALRAAQKMNAQIEADYDHLQKFGRLPDVQPALPLTGAHPAARSPSRCSRGSQDALSRSP